MLPNSSFGSRAAHGTWHTPPPAAGAGWCARLGGPPTGGPRDGPLPRPHSGYTRPQPSSCRPAQSHAWRHAPRSAWTRGPVAQPRPRVIHTSWPGGRRHLLPCALLEGLPEGRRVESPPTTPARTAGTTAPPRTRVLTREGTHARTLTQHPFLRQPHLDHPPLLHVTLVRRARRYANTPARSVPTHWHTALLICTRRAHPGTHTRCPRQAGRPAGGPRTGRPNAPRGRLSACPSTRGSAVVNDAFDGGCICCARSERAPIIWKAEIRNTIYSAALWKQFPNPAQPHSRAASGSRADNDWLFIIFAGNKD